MFRLSDDGEGFEIDRAAHAFSSPDLPVPEVLSTGRAMGRAYAISRRCHGQHLETLPAALSQPLEHALLRLLRALRTTPPPNDRVFWYAPEDATSWRQRLFQGVQDEPDAPAVTEVFRACRSRIESLLPACPERRDLVHSDLLHQNVLVSEDGTRVQGVFSWKCSMLGDFLYDVAWCTFWSPWHPVLTGPAILAKALAAEDLTSADREQAAERHHCYELQIAASHFSWFTFTRDNDNLLRAARAAEEILARGPLRQGRT